MQQGVCRPAVMHALTVLVTNFHQWTWAVQNLSFCKIVSMVAILYLQIYDCVHVCLFCRRSIERDKLFFVWSVFEDQRSSWILESIFPETFSAKLSLWHIRNIQSKYRDTSENVSGKQVRKIVPTSMERLETVCDLQTWREQNECVPVAWLGELKIIAPGRILRISQARKQENKANIHACVQ